METAYSTLTELAAAKQALGKLGFELQQLDEPEVLPKQQLERLTFLFYKLQLTTDHADNLEAIVASQNDYIKTLHTRIEELNSSVGKLERSVTHRAARRLKKVGSRLTKRSG
jgi:hypothetical protein